MIAILRDERGAVTLIEMLTVMAVLSILAVMVLPAQDVLIKETKVLAAIEDIEMIKKALLKFHADIGVWPDDDQQPPADALSDIDLMGGQCGGSGNSEPGTDQGDPGILCQGNPGVNGASVALSPTTASPNFDKATYTVGMARRWRGPYINREIKSNHFAGSYILRLDTDLTTIGGLNAKVPGQTFSFMHPDAKDVLLQLTNVPVEYQLRIDALMDDGDQRTGFVRAFGTNLFVAVAIF